MVRLVTESNFYDVNYNIVICSPSKSRLQLILGGHKTVIKTVF